MEDVSEIALPKMEHPDDKGPFIMDQVKLEDIETPATPDSSKGDSINSLIKIESPKVSKPVLGKIQAKKRLMAFANKFNPIPKVHKLKSKGDKVKRQEKILAIEEIVREESKTKLAAQGMTEALDISIKNALLERQGQGSSKDKKTDEISKRTSFTYKKNMDRYTKERRHSRDRRSRSRSRPRSSRKSSHEDERYSKSRHKDRKDRKDSKDNKDIKEKEKKDKKDDSKHKHETSKHKEEDLKSSDKSKKDDVKVEENKNTDKKIDNVKQDSKTESNKNENEKVDERDKRSNSKKEDILTVNDFKSESIKEILGNKKQVDTKNEKSRNEIKEEPKKVEIKKCDEVKLDKTEKMHNVDKVEKICKVESVKKEIPKVEESNKDEPKEEVSKRDDTKYDTEQKIELKLEKLKKDPKHDINKKEESKVDKLKRDDLKPEIGKREEIRIESKRDDDREDLKTKKDDGTSRRANSRDNKIERNDIKEKREEPRLKIHRDREKDNKIREMREKDLLKCRNWKDFRKYGFYVEDVGFIRRNDIDKSKPRSPQDYTLCLEQMLMLSNTRQNRYAYIAETEDGLPKEYPPEMIKVTKCKPPVFYSENPKYPLYYDRQHLLSILSPNRREKMEDICEATQIRLSLLPISAKNCSIITSEREEGHHERLWYKTMDPSKSISVRSSIDVPSFPRSKWDSENEFSDDNICEVTPPDDVFSKERSRTPVLSTESEAESPKSLPQPEPKIQPQPEPEKSPQPPSKPEVKEIKCTVSEQDNEEQPPKSKSKHKNKHKNSRSPSPKKKEKSKKHKEDKKKHEKHRNREEKHKHHHHKDKKEKTEHLKEPSIDNDTNTQSLTPEPQVGDEKLVSEYEQFMKMVSSTEVPNSGNETVIDVPNQEPLEKPSSPSPFYEFSLESKLSKDSTVPLKLGDISIPIVESTEKINIPTTVPIAKSITTTNKMEEKETVEYNEQKEEDKVIKEPTPIQSQKDTHSESELDESNEHYSSEDEDEDEDSRSIPSDWENVKIKVEKFSDNEISDHDTKAVSTKNKEKSKRKRNRRESWSSDSSSSSSSDSEDVKQKRKKRKRKRPRKQSTSESESSDSSSSDTSSSEEIRKKKRRKTDKKKKKRKRIKKLNKRLKRKRRRKASTDSSSSDSDTKPSKKKRSRKAKTKKKRKLNKQNVESVSEKTKTKPEKSGDSKAYRITKIKEENNSNKSKQAVLESEKTLNQKTVVDEIKLVKSPISSEDTNRGSNVDTFLEWERDIVQRQTANEHRENLKVQDELKSKELPKKLDKSEDVKNESDKSSKTEERDKRDFVKGDSVDTKVDDTEAKKNKKKKKEKELKKENQEFENEWERESKHSAKPAAGDQDTHKFGALEKKPVVDWSDTDFDSLNVLSLTQLEQHVQKREIFANEWEVDSLDAIQESNVPVIKVEPTKVKKVDKGVRYDKKTDTYIPVEVESTLKDSKKKKEKRVSTIRIWEDEQENADREELLLSYEKKATEKQVEQSLAEPEVAKSNTKKINEISTNLNADEKPRRKSRWDVENQPEDFDNALPVMWEVEGNIWPKITNTANTINLMNVKESEKLFNSPLLEAVSARVKDETAKVNTPCFSPPKEINIVDSPEMLRRNLEKIAMLERALSAKDIDLSPSLIIKDLDKSKTFGDKDTLDIEAPHTLDIVKEQKKSMNEISLSKSNKDKSLLSGWNIKGPAIEEASEFGIPVLADIDSKIESSGSSYRDIFLEIDSLNFDNNLINKAEKESTEVNVSEEKSKEMLKLVPKQVLSRQSSEQSKFTSNSPEQFKKKICDIDNHELPKPVENIKTEDVQPSPNSVSLKSPPPKRRSPSRKDRESENRGKSSSKSSEKTSKDKKEYQSRRKSPTTWDSKEPVKSSSASRNTSHSKSRSRSRSPRRRDDRSKQSKRDRRSPVKQSSSHRDHSKTISQSSKSERSKRKYDDLYEHDKSRDKSYDPLALLREKNFDNDRHRSNRSNIEEDNIKSWRHSEFLDDKFINPFPNEYNYESKVKSRDDSLDRDNKSYSRLSSNIKLRSRDSGKSYEKRDKKNSRSPDSMSSTPLSRREKLPSMRKSSPSSRLSRRSSPPKSKHRARSRTRSRSWSRSLSRSRSRSRTRSRSRSRSRSSSRSRYRNHDSRAIDKSRRSRSYSPVRRYNTDRLRIDEEKSRLVEDDLRRLSEGVSRPLSIPHPRPVEPPAASCVTPVRPLVDRQRRNDTIIQLTGGTSETLEESAQLISRNQTPISREVEETPGSIAPHYRYPNENEEPEYNTYYQGRNLTYPRIANEPADSPKRLSLDDRLELELGIKKQPIAETSVPPCYGSPGFIPNTPAYPNIPPGQHHGHFVRHQQTVLQVGNVLQVVPTEYPVRPEPPPPPPVTHANQVVRIGNVIQVVPTTAIDWSIGTQQTSATTPTSGSGVRYVPPSTTGPTSSPAITSPLPPVLQVPPTVKPIIPGLPPPQVVTSPAVTFSAPKPPPPEPVAQPVYNYEAILEARRLEKEERKRLRDLKRKEKERRRFERAKRRAEKILGKTKVTPGTSTSSSGIFTTITGNVLIGNKEGVINEEGESDETKVVIPTTSEEAEEPVVRLSQEAEDEEEDEGDEDEEEEEEAEPEEDEEENEDVEAEEETDDTVVVKQEEISVTVIPPPPAKGILILPGFGNLSMTNGILNELDVQDNEKDKDETKIDDEVKMTTSVTLKIFEKIRIKKSVQFADGIKPGEGTSPSGGEGDMPSPPPPSSNITRGDLTLDISKKLRSRKIRKKQKRTKPQKTKKKVKVKIIKLKKPKPPPITTILEDSDEIDDRSPPPPPPGSPPPPHLWPSYLSIYGPNNTTLPAANGTKVASSVTTNASSSTVVSAPPTPLPLLVPPPPLNYSIQPCSKA